MATFTGTAADETMTSSFVSPTVTSNPPGTRPGSSNDTLSGRGGNDTLSGDGGNDTLSGDDGNDVLSGGAGDDKLNGGNGDDRLDGGAGQDAMVGGDGNDVYVVDNILDRVNFYLDVPWEDDDQPEWVEIHQDPGIDTVEATISYTLRNYLEILILTGTGDINGTGAFGNNTIIGNGGNNFLDGGLGADIMNGGAGDDTYVVDNVGDQVIDSSGVDAVKASVSYTLMTGLENLTLMGSANIDGVGNNADNVLVGNNGNNVLNGGLGADRLDGGGGVDYASYTGSTAGIVVSLGKPANNTGEAAGDIHVSIEGLIGSAFDDALIGDGGTNRLEGGLGADLLNGKAGIDTAVYENAASGVVASLLTRTGIAGEAAGDTYVEIENLSGSQFGDTLTGDNGNNRLTGSGGDDLLYGGAASDTLDGGVGADGLDGGDGIDFASYAGASSGVVVSLGKPANNTGEAAGDIHVSIENLIGSAFDDALIGDSGTNRLSGGLGADRINGKAGIDTAVYESAASGVTASLLNPIGNTGEAAGDTYVEIEYLSGSRFNDMLTGDNTNNRLDGNDGDDVLNGYGGKDTLGGGAGLDTFVFSTALGKTNVDKIVAFDVADDSIALSQWIFTTLGTAGALSADAFHIGSSAQDASDRIIYNQATGSLLYDADGAGGVAAKEFAMISIGIDLTAADFFIV